MLRGLFIFGAGVRPGPGPDLVTVLAKEEQEITHGGRWRSRRDDGPTPRRGKLWYLFCTCIFHLNTYPCTFLHISSSKHCPYTERPVSTE